eukprot:SAG11_NODE_16040_length_558_cov_1.773420_1_plen_123_part_01
MVQQLFVNWAIALPLGSVVYTIQPLPIKLYSNRRNFGVGTSYTSGQRKLTLVHVVIGAATCSFKASARWHGGGDNCHDFFAYRVSDADAVVIVVGITQDSHDVFAAVASSERAERRRSRAAAA